MRFNEVLRRDLAANRGDAKGTFVVVAFRVASAASIWSKGSATRRLAVAPVLLTYRVLVSWVMGIELPSSTSVGPGLRLRHGQGLVVNPGTTFGENVLLRHGVTIGNVRKANGPTGCPVVGDDVEFGANAVVVGDITVGHGAVIGAGTVVTRDVPAGALVRPPRPETVTRD